MGQGITVTEMRRRRGGTLTIVLSADPPGLDPIQLQGVQNWAEAIAVAGIYDALFYPDATTRLQPKMGRSLTTSDGGASWLLELQPGIRFSDGTPLNAEAVSVNWARLADETNRSPVRKHAALIADTNVVNELTLLVTLTAPVPHFDMLVSRYLSSIGSPTAQAAMAGSFAEAPVGAGPFLLSDWERGRHMRLRRNPNYWQKGKPYLDEVVILTGMADAAPKYDAVTSRRAQIALEPLGVNISKYRLQPERYTLMTTPEMGGGVALAMNVTRAPFSDVRLRRALALVLDSAEFVDLTGYDDPAMVMTTIDRTGSPFCDPTICLPERNAKEAQQLIDAIAADTGKPVRFTIETFANEGHIREANVVKQIVERQLQRIAVEVSIGSVAELMAKWRSGEFDASNHAVRWSDPVLDLPATFASASPVNIMGYRNAEVDAALNRLASAADDKAAVVAHHAVLRSVLDDLPVIFLSHKEAFHVVDHDAVRDWRLFYSLRPLIEEAWLAS